MSRVCKLVGDIDTTEVETAFTKGDVSLGEEPERFCTVPFSVYSAKIPLLLSEHKLSLLQKGHVEVTGTLMSVYKRKQIPQFYFYVNDMISVEPDVIPTNTVSFVGTITRQRQITHDDAGRDVFTVTISDLSPLGEASLLYVAFRGAIARKWAHLEKDQKICGTGYLKHYRSTYEIYAQDVKVL